MGERDNTFNFRYHYKKGMTVSLYRFLGWQVSGEIPEFAQAVDGKFEATTIMFKLKPESNS